MGIVGVVGCGGVGRLRGVVGGGGRLVGRGWLVGGCGGIGGGGGMVGGGGSLVGGSGVGGGLVGGGGVGSLVSETKERNSHFNSNMWNISL